MMNKFDIAVYQTEAGKAPFAEWLKTLKDGEAKRIIAKRIARIQLGSLGDHKSVGDEVFEMRVFAGPGYRVYFAKEGQTIILLLLGGDKSTQTADIKAAKANLKDYRRQNNE